MTNTSTNNNQKRMRIFAAGLLAVIVILGGISYHVFKRHNLQLSDLTNPRVFMRYLEPERNYDPDTAMLYHGNPDLKEVALTIDDGPNPIYGPQILSVLEQYHVPATFFVVGVRVNQSPQLIQRMVADGDEVGNHTYDHQRLTGLRPHEIADELEFNDVDIYRAAGIHTYIMRPPGMDYNDKVTDIIKALGYTTVSWTVAAKDYLSQPPDFIADTVLDRSENGSIILLHQDTPDTALALPYIIQGLEKKGYSFVTISTMLDHLNVKPVLASNSMHHLIPLYDTPPVTAQAKAKGAAA